MKIYVCHSKSFDYKSELYEPLRLSPLNQLHEIILPHEFSEQSFNSKEVIPTVDLVLAEVSFPSTGMGIELGWANKDGKRIVFIYKQGTSLSASLKAVSEEFVEYISTADLTNKLQTVLNHEPN